MPGGLCAAMFIVVGDPANLAAGDFAPPDVNERITFFDKLAQFATIRIRAEQDRAIRKAQHIHSIVINMRFGSVVVTGKQQDVKILFTGFLLNAAEIGEEKVVFVVGEDSLVAEDANQSIAAVNEHLGDGIGRI